MPKGQTGKQLWKPTDHGYDLIEDTRNGATIYTCTKCGHSVKKEPNKPPQVLIQGDGSFTHTQIFHLDVE